MTARDPQTGRPGETTGDLFSAFRREPIAFVRNMARAGDISRIDIAGQPVFLFNHPDLIRDVLVTNNASFSKAITTDSVKQFLGEGLLTAEGEAHRRRRRLAQPAFHRQRVASYAETIVSRGERAAEQLRAGAQTDVAYEMMRLTLGIAGKTLFDADVEGDAKVVGDAIAEISEFSNLIAFPLINHVEKFMLSGRRRFDQARARLDETIYRIIAERRAAGTDRGDLLSMLLLATDDDGDGGLTDEQLRDEVMTIFLASHDTTANGLTWTWHLLSRHPEVQLRLHEEIDAVLGGRLPTVEDLPRLGFVERVLAESMRVLPPVWIMARKTVTDYEVGGVTLPAGSIVLMSQYLIHHDARFFDDPETFAPDRWTPEMKASLPRFAYFPFGGGPRQCIGESFAMMEATLLVATIAQRWRFEPVPGFEPKLQPGIILRPKHGLHLTPHPWRDSCVACIDEYL